MPGPIQDLLDSEEFHQNGWVRVVSSRWEGTHAQLELAIDEGQGGRTLAVWRVGCDGVRDFLICEIDGGGLGIRNGEHPAVRQYCEPHTSLLLRGKPADPLRLIGALWLAHRRAVDDWIDFDRYLEMPLEERLAEGDGKIAEGPRFLLSEYAAVLRGHHVEVSFTDESSSNEVNGSALQEQRSALHLIHFGASYVVAERFTSERVARGAG